MQWPPTRPGVNLRKFHLVPAASSTSWTERPIFWKIVATSGELVLPGHLDRLMQITIRGVPVDVNAFAERVLPLLHTTLLYTIPHCIRVPGAPAGAGAGGVGRPPGRPGHGIVVDWKAVKAKALTPELARSKFSGGSK